MKRKLGQFVINGGEMNSRGEEIWKLAGEWLAKKRDSSKNEEFKICTFNISVPLCTRGKENRTFLNWLKREREKQTEYFQKIMMGKYK